MRIGFIGVSGIRVCKPEVVELGMSFPALAGRVKEIEALPSLGLLTLAGMTPPHIDCEYLEVRDVELDDLPKRFDAVAISSLSGTNKEAFRLCERFRDIGTPTVLGGLGPTLQPELSAKYADAVVIGEGEPAWPQVVADLERQQLLDDCDFARRWVEARLRRANGPDRKSTRLNSSHALIPYAVFCLKKQKNPPNEPPRHQI